MLFNAANVTINLETGAVRGQRHEDLLTKISPVRYEPGATCPKWLAFLDRIFASDHSLSDFIQRAVGYSLTGLTVEQVFFIMYGTGANGKTVFLSILTALFGEYAQWTEFSTFLMRDKDSIRNDLAALKGARLVSAAESSQGRRLDETVIKQVTGGDAIRARFLHKEFFEYSPEFTVWLATNHKPEVRGNDHALWRRIRLLPFTVTISNDEQDRGLTRKLLEELPGILNWALDGLASWRDSGLGYPDVVREATELYRDDMDFLRDFLSEVTIVEPQAYTLHRDLFLAYKQWSDDNSERPVGAKRFTQLLVERNYERGKFGTSSARGFGGLVLRGGWPRTEI